MTTATQVPTNGFVAPPAVPAPAPAPDAGGFHVPPAGPAAALPNGHVTAAPNQQPGWVPNPGQPPVQPQQQTQPNQQAAPDLLAVTAMLQAALAGQQAQAAPAQAPGVANTQVGGYDLNSVDDPIIKAMATVMQTTAKGIDLNRAIGNAISFGDAALIDAAYLREVGGANAAQLVEIANGIVASVNSKAQAVTNEVHAMVGGEANWNTSVAAFNQSAPHALRVTVGQMLDSANPALIKAGASMVAEFGKQSGHIPQQGTPLLNTASAGLQGQGLSKAAFKQELAKLDRRDENAYAEAVNQLKARRVLGVRNGLE